MSIAIKYKDSETPVTITNPLSFTVTAGSLTYTTKTNVQSEIVTIHMSALDYVNITN